MILALKTDSNDSEIYLLNPDGTIAKQKVWSSGRTLARDLLDEIDSLIDGKFSDLAGVIIFKGPGSFTGLRIGITTANALAYSENIPIVGTSGDNWLNDGLKELKASKDNKIVLPEYGSPVNITKPKK